mgnify:CR=1 FL=1
MARKKREKSERDRLIEELLDSLDDPSEFPTSVADSAG